MLYPYRGKGNGAEAGAAYATVISQAAAFIGAVHTYVRQNLHKVGFKRGIYFVRSMDIKLLSIACLSLEASTNLGYFIVMKFIASFG